MTCMDCSQHLPQRHTQQLCEHRAVTFITNVSVPAASSSAQWPQVAEAAVLGMQGDASVLLESSVGSSVPDCPDPQWLLPVLFHFVSSQGSGQASFLQLSEHVSCCNKHSVRTLGYTRARTKCSQSAGPQGHSPLCPVVPKRSHLPHIPIS